MIPLQGLSDKVSHLQNLDRKYHKRTESDSKVNYFSGFHVNFMFRNIAMTAWSICFDNY